MRCEKHPDSDAVGTCVSCGRGICPICKISYNNMLHCKECIESARISGQANDPNAGYDPSPLGQQTQQTYGYSYPTYPAHYPKPTGPPSKSFFKAGFGGCIGTAIVCMVMGFSFSIGGWGYTVQSGYWLIAVSLVLMIMMLPFAVGLYGFHRNYGTSWGLWGSIGIVICSMLFFSFIAAAIALADTRSYSDNIFPRMSFLYLGELCLGIGLMVSAAAVDQSRRYLAPSRQANGMMTWAALGLLVAGVMFMAFIGIYMVGWIVLSVSMFLLSIEFYHAPVPEWEPDKTSDQGWVTGTGTTGPYQAQPTTTTSPTNPYDSTNQYGGSEGQGYGGTGSSTMNTGSDQYWR